jgi:hypothetical protein
LSEPGMLSPGSIPLPWLYPSGMSDLHRSMELPGACGFPLAWQARLNRRVTAVTFKAECGAFGTLG